MSSLLAQACNGSCVGHLGAFEASRPGDRFAEGKFQARLRDVEKSSAAPGSLARKRQELMLEAAS